MAMTVAQIKANISTIAKNAAELNILIHDTALGTMIHCAEHKDATLSQALVMAMPASLRREQLIDWFRSYSPIALRNEADWPGKIVKAGKIAERGYQIEAAKNDPWYARAEKNKEKVSKPLSLDALIAAVRGYSSKINKELEDKRIPDSDRIAARLLAGYLEHMTFPDFRLEAYKLKAEAEKVANDTMITPEPEGEGETGQELPKAANA